MQGDYKRTKKSPPASFGELSVQNGYILFRILGLSWYKKLNACCFRIDTNAVLGTEKGQL